MASAICSAATATASEMSRSCCWMILTISAGGQRSMSRLAASRSWLMDRTIPPWRSLPSGGDGGKVLDELYGALGGQLLLRREAAPELESRRGLAGQAGRLDEPQRLLGQAFQLRGPPLARIEHGDLEGEQGEVVDNPVVEAGMRLLESGFRLLEAAEAGGDPTLEAEQPGPLERKALRRLAEAARKLLDLAVTSEVAESAGALDLHAE